MAIILDSMVGSCARKLQEIITEQAILILGVKEELREMQRTMEQIQCFLSDAEQRRIEDSAVNHWLGELRDAMYDADDIIDLARLEGSKLLADHTSSSLLRKSSACTGLSFFSCLPNVPRHHKIAVAIRNLNTDLEKIAKRGDRFLKPQILQPKERVSASKLTKPGPLVEPNLVGKEIRHACTDLVNQVLEHKENKTYKIAVVGTGGVGKTTLAQKIYNDQKINGTYTKRAWICVSQDYSQVDLLKVLLQNFGVHHEQSETVGELQGKLAVVVEEMSFFLVLDDVWQPQVWTDLMRTPLHAAAKGIVILTTRHDTVAQAIGVDHVHRVQLMSQEVGWELLWKSMNIDEETQVQNLRDIGMEIVRKCGGLPLAIKLIASVLATKERTENQWRKFINKSAWSMRKLPADLRGALYLSYDELPQYLKQCFHYCALYPEDSLIYRDDLIRFWVAEGFIEEQEEQLLEDTAKEYFNELLHRNLLQPDLLYFDPKHCRMHDLLRQLAQHLSAEESFCGDPQSLDAATFSKLRRVSVLTDKDSVMLPNIESEQNRVRTLITNSTMAPRVEKAIFSMLPRIRVLDLTDSSIPSIPDRIESMIHLRLLDLDRTDVSCLPESIGSLINLQVLNLQGCKSLHSLPSAVTKLCNLRRLGLRDTPINQVPKGIGKLKFLNDLEGFPIGGSNGNAKAQDGWKMEEVASLMQLRRLNLIQLERSVHCSADPLLADKKHLRYLELSCSAARTGKPNLEGDVSRIEKIFDQLIPPHSLEDLVIFGFFGRRYPTWLATAHLFSMTSLILFDCHSCVHLPPLGKLPSLKYFRVHGATTITKIGPEFVGCAVHDFRSPEMAAFPKLECFVIRCMPNWEEWSFVQGEEEDDDEEEEEVAEALPQSRRLPLFPRLIMLVLQECPKLRALPQQLGQEASCLRELYLSGVSCMKAVEDLPFLSERLLLQGCPGLERVSNLPQVRQACVRSCPNFHRVEGLGSLRQLWLGDCMRDISSLWLSALQQQHRQMHGEDLDVYTWQHDDE